LPGVAGLAAPDLVGLPAPGDREQPGVRIVRHTIGRPHAQRRGKGLAERVLGSRDIACAGGEEGDEAAIALARNALGSPGSLVRMVQFRLPCAWTTGRISIEPYLLDGQRLAQAMAPSRS